MSAPYIPDNDQHIVKILEQWEFPATLLGAVRYGGGHINDTFCVVCQPKGGDAVRFILQGISTLAFPEPEKLMENFVGITTYMRKKIIEQGGDPDREALCLVKTRDGRDYYKDETGKVWRMTKFVENTDCFQNATPELFEASARAFGRCQRMMEGYPVETLHETIARFHDTENRLNNLNKAVEADPLGRVKDCLPEIEFYRARKADCSVCLDLQRAGKLPLRVTNNDAKLDNILFDRYTHEGICMLDLDTTMPGLSINDFGDSIRFGANHCAEDEADLSKVNLDMDLYEVYTRGYLEGTDGCLTETELDCMPWGAKLMTMETGMRFLTDYIEGDVYYHTDYAGQNLLRTRTQIKLIQDMEAHWQEMHDIVWKYAKK